MPGPVKSAQRALEILDLLTRREAPTTFVELADQLGYPRSSLHGLVQTLVTSGWVSFDDRSRGYTLGIRALEAGNAYTRAVGLVDRAAPAMRRIRDAMDETVQLAVLEGRHNVYVAKFDGGQALTLASEVGRRLPAHATGVGKVLLAGLDEVELEQRLKGVRLETHTAHTLTDVDVLRDNLQEVRRRGFGVDNEEYTAGIRCVAVPVFDYTNKVIAGMSVSVPTIRFDRGFRPRALSLLLEGAKEISSSLGHPPA